MKKYSNYYHDGKIKYNGKNFYYYQDKNNYLFSMGIYHTKIKEEDLPDYYIKLWLYPRYKYLSLKNIVDIFYRPNFFTNHYRKDDLLYISYKDKISVNNDNYGKNFDVVIYGPSIDTFIDKLSKYNYDKKKIDKIKKLMDKKDRWYRYWDEHNWNGNYSYTSNEIRNEILNDKKIFIISDTHFNHENIIKYCNRPYKNIKEVNETIISNWNTVVKKNDIVYHLGDFFLGSKYDLNNIISKLNGTIYLIRGNHDRLTVKSYEDNGIKVLKNAPIILEEYKVILSHKPLPDSMIKEGYINIHAHIHQKKLEDIYDSELFCKDKHINVSSDVLDFKPILLYDLLRVYKK